MTLPTKAWFEDAPALGVAIYDVVNALPRHSRKRYPGRNPRIISRIYIHHSGADNPHADGFEAMEDSAHYVVGYRNWPGFAYTFWFARKADRDRLNRLVVYRGNYDDTRSWHTGGFHNGRGIALCLEGNTTRQSLTEDQLEALEAMIPYLAQRHERIELPASLRMHSEARLHKKPACPGRSAEGWIRRYRRFVHHFGP